MEKDYNERHDKGGLSMRKVLIFGGTRYFGRRLALRLAESGDDVTIVTRGEHTPPVAKGLTFFKGDRTSSSTMKDLGSQNWDIIYDNICFNPYQAKLAVDAFEGKVGRYILTSTMSVYEQGGTNISERTYNPFPGKYDLEKEHDYGEGKRQAESYFFQRATFPVIAVRFPVVLGPDDYTERLVFHIKRVLADQPIVAENLYAKMGYISSYEAAAFLEWCGRSTMTGPINAASDGVLSIQDLMDKIDRVAKTTSRFETTGEEPSPLAPERDFYMDTTAAKQAGYLFQHVDDWLDRLIEEEVRNHK
ncbi:NAD-dependent epimerase/dehydratase [Exiguobacterium antarcticum B7]|nr:NAD-dependent epimerase/dehydratase [Exiguobacterium antarcticum B7]